MEKYHKRTGYTLIEILVAISIIGLIFGFGYVSFREFARRQAISGTAKKIKGDLRLAQSLALAGEKPDDAKCNPPAVLNGFAFRVSPPYTYFIEVTCSGGTVIDRTVDLPSDISLSSPSPNPILFKVLGQGTNIPQGATATITLTQAGTGSRITVTITSGGEIK